MVRKLEKSRYWMAAAFTAMIFAFGLSVGMLAEQQRAKYVTEQYQQQSNDYESLQLQYAYLTSLSAERENCPTLQYSLNTYIQHLEDTRLKLENYQESSSKINKAEFENLKRQYILAEIKAWMFTQKVQESCNETDIVTILNFHSKDCERCDDEGMILSYFKDIFKDKLMIFSIDTDYGNESMVALLEKTYKVENYPTLIVDNQKIGGFIGTEELKKVLCAHYQNESNCGQK